MDKKPSDKDKQKKDAKEEMVQLWLTDLQGGKDKGKGPEPKPPQPKK